MPRLCPRAAAHENRAFLAELRRTGNAREAARAVGLSRTRFTKRRARDPRFAAAWEAALAFADAALQSSPAPQERGRGTAPVGRGGGGTSGCVLKRNAAPKHPPRTVRTRAGLQLRGAPRDAITPDAEQRFLLALSATANVRLAARLRDAEMIKLPIELVADEKAHWKDTLKAALDKRADLEAQAREHHDRTDRFIRPIMLVRVERTGRDQRDGVHIHTEDVFEELTQKLGVPPEWVRRQTAVDKELDDGLMAETSQVRVIITKDALREGWDCPFAYVLALLSKTQAATALTQMIGRVLRQPGARRTGTGGGVLPRVAPGACRAGDATKSILTSSCACQAMAVDCLCWRPRASSSTTRRRRSSVN